MFSSRRIPDSPAWLAARPRQAEDVPDLTPRGRQVSYLGALFRRRMAPGDRHVMRRSWSAARRRGPAASSGQRGQVVTAGHRGLRAARNPVALMDPGVPAPRAGPSGPPILLTDLVDHLLAEYRLTLQEDRRSLFDRFTEVDVVRQVVGVGSVGMQVFLVLLEGRSGADPLFLQVKQAGSSVYEAHTHPSRHDNHGARVVNGKRLVQSATDIFVGWGSLHGKDYYVRQFRDMKIIPTTELIAPRLVEFATACGETLARAHARTGDPVAIDGYIGKGPKFAAAIGRFARFYAEQNERDHAQLVSAIAAGAVESLPG
jgi:hypothetical protein